MNQLPLSGDPYDPSQSHNANSMLLSYNNPQPSILHSPTSSSTHPTYQHAYPQQQQQHQMVNHNVGSPTIMNGAIGSTTTATSLPANVITTTSPTTPNATNGLVGSPQQIQQQQQQYGCVGYDSPKLATMNPIFQMDLKSHPHFQSTNPYFEGLSKPALSPYLNFGSSNGYLCMMGTENQSSTKNSLILSRVENNYNNVLRVQHVDEHLRYLEWLPKDPRRIIIAANGELGIVVLNEELNDINVIDIFPKFHHDTIRQFAINPVNQSLVISGGFDEKVFVTDISKLVDDIQTNQVKSENSVYLCQDVVSCVRFHPSDSNVASATTDQGVLHVFDVRTGNTSKPAFVYDTSKYDLFTHVYLDDFTVCLGYGDGSIQVHDIRTGKTLISFTDKAVSVIGDFVYEPQKKLLVSLGMNKFSVYQVNPTNFELIHSAYQPVPSITNGNYLSEMNQFITTDSFGHVSLYDL